MLEIFGGKDHMIIHNIEFVEHKVVCIQYLTNKQIGFSFYIFWPVYDPIRSIYDSIRSDYRS